MTVRATITNKKGREFTLKTVTRQQGSKWIGYVYDTTTGIEVLRVKGRYSSKQEAEDDAALCMNDFIRRYDGA